jgi:hypothetical protein
VSSISVYSFSHVLCIHSIPPEISARAPTDHNTPRSAIIEKIFHWTLTRWPRSAAHRARGVLRAAQRWLLLTVFHLAPITLLSRHLPTTSLRMDPSGANPHRTRGGAPPPSPMRARPRGIRNFPAAPNPNAPKLRIRRRRGRLPKSRKRESAK